MAIFLHLQEMCFLEQQSQALSTCSGFYNHADKLSEATQALQQTALSILAAETWTGQMEPVGSFVAMTKT